ncbi:MAG: hypothetical protein EXR21_09565 [Flavobacteriaceae bacterium]|nr:hypothetical protein [Flavobacteriaceae bacterium]
MAASLTTPLPYKFLNDMKNSQYKFLILVLFAPLLCKCQIENKETTLNFSIGDTVLFEPCSGKESYQFIDLYTKTRIIDTSLWYNEETGEGFYSMFFLTGDLDGKRLPCNFQKLTATIITAMQVKDKNTKTDKWVVLAWVNKKERRVVWIEVEKALHAGEVRIKH